MSIRDLAVADVQANLEADGDAVTLIAPDGTEYEMTGRVLRVDETIDPDTGAKIHDPRTVVTIPTAGLPASSPTEEWRASSTDGNGAEVSGRVMAPRFDRTMAYVTFDIEVFDEVESG